MNKDNEQDKTLRIRTLNDQFRTMVMGNGTIVMTHRIQEFGDDNIVKIANIVQTYDDFSQENDPHGEHDFGAFDFQEHKPFWKIDYYDLSLKMHSPDPSDEQITHRVLTIMLASEY